MTVMSDFLGVEPERRDEFRIWTLTRIMGMFDPKRNGTPEFVESTDAAARLLLRSASPTPSGHRCGGLVDRLVGVGELSPRRDGRPADHHARRRDHHHRRPDRQHAPRAAHHARRARRAPRRPVAGARRRSRRRCASTPRRCRPGASSPRTPSCSGSRWPPGTWLRLMTAGIGRDPERNPDPDTLLCCIANARSTSPSAAGCTTASACTSASSRRSSPCDCCSTATRASTLADTPDAGVAPGHPRLPRLRAPRGSRSP